MATASAAPAPLRPWNSALKHTDRERWICIYPAYINRKKTRQEGRRIPKECAVENPSFQEIRDVLQVLNLNVIVENKQYSREKSKELAFRGRIRVQLKQNDGKPVLPEYPTRDSILLYLGKTIPQLKTRQGKPTEPAQQQASGSSGGGGGASGGGGSSGGGSSHKKGKGKRR
ncbi:signal recognition particle 19 kDa protein [Uranotaenia lowii]|uniref:signal recognition particle 19 kDa protein n=1 Tax=Uranotaenia lowii TaxID=190385 RepID=UPI0024790537|nr:signal recognition particle 19 kDa protein [Uranotaenia lowii]